MSEQEKLNVELSVLVKLISESYDLQARARAAHVDASIEHASAKREYDNLHDRMYLESSGKTAALKKADADANCFGTDEHLQLIECEDLLARTKAALEDAAQSVESHRLTVRVLELYAPSGREY